MDELRRKRQRTHKRHFRLVVKSISNDEIRCDEKFHVGCRHS